MSNTFTSARDFIDQIEEREAQRRAKTFFIKLWLEDSSRWLKWNVFNNLVWFFSFIASRLRSIRYGYDPEMFWCYSYYNSRMAVKMLTKIRDRGHTMPGIFGCKLCVPGNHQYTAWNCPCKPFDRWRDTISDMIYYHQIVAGIDDLDWIDLEDLPEEMMRYKRGRVAYHRYYESLSD